MGRVTETMTTLKRAGNKALVPFLTAGFPSPESFPELLAAIAEIADIVEIGVPFSDPLADGPIIQHTSQVALEQGVNLPMIMETLTELNRDGRIAAPLVLMSYLNPLLQYGRRTLLETAERAGVAGLIVPDLPAEEGEELSLEVKNHQLDLICLLAPTTGDKRARMIAHQSQGFIYLVSITGVTGERNEFPPETIEFLQRIRAVTDKPICIGFGISRPEQVRQVAPHVDGVIIGSALLRVVMENLSNPIKYVRDFLISFKQVLEDVKS